MKKNTLTIKLLLILAAFVTPTAGAGELLIGAKAGIMDPEFDDSAIIKDDPFATATLGIGYEFLDLVAVDIGAELEYTTSLTDPDLSGFDSSYESTGLILSVRTAGPIYVVGRAGRVEHEFDYPEGLTLSIPGLTPTTIEDDADVIGVGIGFSTGLRWEIQLDSHSYKDDGGSAQHLTFALSF